MPSIEYYRTVDDEIYCGISRKEFPSWEGWTIIDNAKLKVGLSEISIIRYLSNNETIQEIVDKFYLVIKKFACS
jgi:hypothetical protein